jgi:dolichyl-phosphate beta-glucosyltransferase
MKVSVVIPAYNEESRITSTLQAVSSFLSKQNFEYEVLVVDDGSRDKTIVTVEGLALPNVRVVTYGRNRGKGFAVNYGMKQATGDWILMTDADNSTPIEELTKLLAVTDTSEVVIGSRYIRESHITLRQGVPRIVMSRLGNLLVQLLILPGIRDTQCGFKLLSAKAARDILPLQTIWGWGFDMELLRIAKEQGYKIKEVGVTWQNDDQSRIQSSSVFTKTLRELFAIRQNSWRGQYRGQRSELGKLARFAVVGAIGTTLDYLVLNFLHLALGLGLYWALTLGFTAGALNNYLLNSLWSFRQPLSWTKLGQFLTVALVGLGFNNGIVFLLGEYLSIHYNVAKLVAIFVVFFWNYLANRYWTFSGRD